MSLNATTINITTASIKNLNASTVTGTGRASSGDVATGTEKLKIVTPASLANLFGSVGNLGTNSAATGTFGAVTASGINGQAMANIKTVITATDTTKAINPYGVKAALLNPPAIGSISANSGQFVNVTAGSIDTTSSALAVLADINGSQSGVYTPTYTWTVAGGAKLSTSTTKYGTASLAVLASGDYIQTSITPPSNEWTIEFWFNVTAVADNLNTLIGNSTEYLIALAYDPVTEKINAFMSSDGATWDISLYDATDNTASAATWNHVALQYDGFQYALYLNGTKTVISTSTPPAIHDSAWSTLRFGDWGWSTDYANGYIDELRISNIARYGDSFTPSSSEFVRDLNTLILNHFNGSNLSTNINATEDTALLGYVHNKVLTPYSFINMLKSPPSIGTTTPNSATFTNVTISGTLTLNNPATPIQGGTGASTYSKGDLLIGAGGSNLAKLSVGSDGKYFKSNSHALYGVDWENAGSGIQTTARPLFATSTEALNSSITDKAIAPSVIPYIASKSYPIGSTTANAGTFTNVTVLNGITLANAISLAQGGTGFTSYSDNDLLVGNSSNTLSKLTVGAANKYLKSDPAQTLGMSWVTGTAPEAESSTINNYNYISKPELVSSTSWSFDTIYITDSSGSAVEATNTSFDVTTTGEDGIAQSSNLTGTVSLSRTNPYTITGSSTTFTTSFQVGDVIYINDRSAGRVITAIDSNTSLTIDSPFSTSSNVWVNKVTDSNLPYINGTDCYRLTNPKYGVGSAFTNGIDMQFKLTLGLTSTPTSWTYEFWYTHSSSGASNMIFHIPGYIHIGRVTGNGANLVYTLYNGSGVNMANGSTYNPSVTNGAYVHIAYCFDSNRYSLFVNGTRVFNSNASQPNLSLDVLKTITFGSVSGTTENIYIDEFRFSNVARYSGSTYSIPIDRFTWDSNTVSLQHFDHIDFNTTDEANYIESSSLTYKRGGYASNSRYSLYCFTQSSSSSLLLSTRSTNLGHTLVDIPSAISSYTRAQLPYIVDICNDQVTIIQDTSLPDDHIDIGTPNMLDKLRYIIPYCSTTANNKNLIIKGSKTIDVQKTGAYGIASGAITGNVSKAVTTTLTGLGTEFTSDLRAGDIITINGQSRSVSTITNNTTLTVNSAFTNIPSWTGTDSVTVGDITPVSTSNALYSPNGTTSSNYKLYTHGLSVPTNWTIEIWFYPRRRTGYRLGLFSDWNPGNILSALVQTGGLMEVWFNTVSATNLASWQIILQTTNVINENDWNHVAVQFDGSGYRVILNGDYSSSGYSASTSSVSSILWSNLQFFNSSGNYGFEGYVDSIRISNVSRYTGAFTPGELTSDANVLSLNTFNSSTSLSTSEQISGITWSGNNPVYSNLQSKYGSTSLYCKGYPAHMYSNVSGLTAPSDAWTLEMWFNLSSILKNTNCLIGNYSNNIMKFGINSSGFVVLYLSTTTVGGFINSTGTTIIALSTWYHIALVFTGSQYIVYLNGEPDITVNSALPVDPKVFSQMVIGRAVADTTWYMLDGYIDELRISNIARYTGSFTPASSVFVRDVNTILLNHFDVDDQSVALSTSEDPILTTEYIEDDITYSVIGAALTTEDSKFGGSSVLVSGGGITISGVPQNLGSWTIEFWVKPTNDGSNKSFLVLSDIYGFTKVSVHYWALNLVMLAAGGESSQVAVGAAWTHFAIVYSGTHYYFFINGVLVPSTPFAGATAGSGWDKVILMSNGLTGYLDELRISNYPRYFSNFTVPTAPFVRDSNTVLLNHFNSTTYTLPYSPTVYQTISAWGPFAQATASSQPTYYSSGGYLDGPYINFKRTRARFMTIGSTVFQRQTNGGFSAAALVKFTGDVVQSEVIFDLSTGSNNNGRFSLARNGITSDLKVVAYNSGGGVLVATNTTNTNIIQEEWAVFSLLYSYATGVISVYKNGTLIITASPVLLPDLTTPNIYIGRPGYLIDSYSNMNIQRLYMYDACLSSSDHTTLVNAILAGSAHPSLAVSPLVSADSSSSTTLPSIPSYTITNNKAALSSIQYKFGATSLYLHNNYSSFSTANNNILIQSLPNTPSAWTIELFAYINYLDHSASTIVSTNTKGILLAITNTGTVQLSISTDGSTYDITGSSSAGAITTGSWKHIAIVFNGTTYVTYVAGTAVLTINNSNTVNSTSFNTIAIGKDLVSNGNYLDSYIDELRISNSARYSGNFSPTASAFVSDGNTLVLEHFETVTTLGTGGDYTTTGTYTITYDYTLTGSYTLTTSKYKFGISSGLFDSTYFTISNLPSILTPWTLECWLYPNTLTNCTLFTTSSYGVRLLLATNGTLTLESTANGTTWGLSQGSSSNITVSTWSHIALVYDRTTTSLTLYLNGSSVGVIATTSIPTAELSEWIFGYASGVYYDGHIDELRLSKNKRYTGAFTPSTIAFTRDANTLLLNHFDISASTDFNATEDQSISTSTDLIPNYTPTYTWSVYGTAKLSRQNNKFGVSSLRIIRADTSYVIVSSGPNTPASWTISFWCYPSNLDNDMSLLTNSSGLLDISILTTGYISVSVGEYSAGDVFNNQQSSNTITATSWSHIELAYNESGGSYNIFVNGTKTALALSVANLPSSVFNTINLGRSATTAGRNFDGYIDEFRLTNDVKHTSSFSPRESSDLRDSTTLILNHFDGNDGVTNLNNTEDRITRTNTTVSPAATWQVYNSCGVSTNAFMFGTASLYCTRTGNKYVRVHSLPTNVEEWCMEAWVYLLDNGATYSTIFSLDANYELQLVVDHTNSNKLGLYVGNSTSWAHSNNTLSTPTISLNTWTHIMMNYNTLEGYRVFLNGTSVITIAKCYSHSISEIHLGSNYVWSSVSTTNWNGYIDEFRYSNCLRYHTTFCPQLVAYVRDTNCLSLAHFNGTTGSSPVEDLIIPATITTTWSANTGKLPVIDGAKYNSPQDIAVDSSGNTYVADSTNGIIRKIDTSGNVSTFSKYVLNNPTGIAVDGSDNVYVSETGANCVWKFSPSGVGVRISGDGTVGSINSGDTALTSTQLGTPADLVYNSNGDLFITEETNRIRQLSNGILTIFTGTGGTLTTTDGVWTVSKFNLAYGVVVDTNDNLYVSEYTGCFIRKVTPSGYVSTIAGTGTASSVDGPAKSATFNNPAGMAIDTSNNIYICDYTGNKIRKLTSTGYVSTFAGSGTASSIDGFGTGSTFNRPDRICIDSSGNLYVTEYTGNKIRKILPTGLVTTLAGSGTASSVNGTGISATFNNPKGICVDGSGNVYVTEYTGGNVRKITPDGVVTTLTTGLTNPTGIRLGTNNNLLILERSGHRLKSLDLSDNSVTTILGTGTSGTTVNGSRHAGPTGLVVNGTDIYVCDASGNRIRKISNGLTTTFAGSGSPGANDATGTSATFNGPTYCTLDASGNLVVSDTNTHKIRKITIPDAVVTTYAGSGTTASTDGQDTSASFYNPRGITKDADGNLYVVDRGTHKIRKINTSGYVTTIGGSGSSGAADTPDTSANFPSSLGVWFDASDSNSITKSGNNITQVADKSGNSRNATPTSAGATIPTYNATAINGMGAIAFSGSDGKGIVGSGIGDVAVWSAFFVLKYTANGFLPVLLISDGGWANGSTVIGAYSGTLLSVGINNAGTGQTATSTFGPVVGTTYVFSIVDSGTSISAYINGTVIINASTVMNNGVARRFSTIDIGTWSGQTSRVYNGYLGEFQMYNTNLSSSDRINIENYLMAKWGIPLGSSFNTPGGIAAYSTNLFIADSGNNKIRKIDNTTASVSTYSGQPNVVSTAGFINTSAISNATQSSIVKYGSRALEIKDNSSSVAIGNMNIATSRPWTMQFWFYTFADGAATRYLFNATYSRSTSGILIGITQTNTLITYMGASSWDIVNGVQSSNLILGGQWNHLILQFNGTTYQLYLNGVRTQLASSTTAVHFETFKAIKFGYYDAGSSLNAFTGYIDDFRLSNIARYGITNVGVPVSEFINDVYSVSVNHFNSTSSDISDSEDLSQYPVDLPIWSTLSNSLDLSKIPVLSTTQKKFGTSSLSFNGSQAVVINKNWAALGSWWTIEFWAYLSSANAGQYLLSQDTYDPSITSQLAIKVIQNQLVFYIGNSFAIVNGGNTSGTFVDSAWNHIALCYTYNGWWVYLNGVGTQLTSSTTAITLYPFVLGYYNNTYYNGYIDELRISSICRYNGNFTIQTSEHAMDSYVLCLNHFNGLSGSTNLNLTEDIDYNLLCNKISYGTQGSARTSLTKKKFGSSSLYLSSLNDSVYLGALYHPIKPWTIEGYTYIKRSATNNTLFGSLEATDNSSTNVYRTNGATGVAIILANASTTIINTSATYTIHAGNWHHFAVVYDGLDTYRIYFDGLCLITSTVYDKRVLNSLFTNLSLGNSASYTYPLAGHIDEFRVSNANRYKNFSFTPPNAAFVSDSATLALNHFEGTNNTLVSGAVSGITYSSSEIIKIGAPPTQLFSSDSYSFVNPTSIENVLLTNLVNSMTPVPTSWTIEMWVHLNGYTSYTTTPIIASSGLQICVKYPSGYLTLITPDNVTTISSTQIPFMQWTHIALTYDGTTYKLYSGGVLAQSYTSSVSTNALVNIYLGCNSTLAGVRNVPMFGSNFRVSKTLRYSGASFTVPASAFVTDSNTISLHTLSTSTFTSGEIGFGLTIYRGGLYYNKIYSVYIVEHNNGQSPVYLISDRNVAYGQPLVDIPSGYSTTNYKQLPIYLVTEDNSANELALRQYYYIKDFCAITINNSRLATTSVTSTTYTTTNSQFTSYIPLSAKRYKLNVQLTDTTFGGSVVRFADDSTETNFVDIVNNTQGTRSFQYVDAPCYAGFSYIKVALTGTTASIGVSGFYLDDE